MANTGWVKTDNPNSILVVRYVPDAVGLRPPGYEHPDSRLRLCKPSPLPHTVSSQTSTCVAASPPSRTVPVTHLATTPADRNPPAVPVEGSGYPNHLDVHGLATHLPGPSRVAGRDDIEKLLPDMPN